METKDIYIWKEELDKTKKLLEDYKVILDGNTLEKENYIVKLGVYTVSSNDNNTVTIEMTPFPTQWAEEQADDFVKNLVGKTDSGATVACEKIKAIDWYQNEVSINEAVVAAITEKLKTINL